MYSKFLMFSVKTFQDEFLGSKDEFHEPPKWERMESLDVFPSLFLSQNRVNFILGAPKRQLWDCGCCYLCWWSP